MHLYALFMNTHTGGAERRVEPVDADDFNSSSAGISHGDGILLDGEVAHALRCSADAHHEAANAKAAPLR